MIKLKNRNIIYYLFNYCNDKNIILNKTYSLFKAFNNKIDKIDYLINSYNNSSHSVVKIHKLLDFIKCNETINNSKSYNLLKDFKKEWFKLNTNSIFLKNIEADEVYIWLAYTLNLMTYENYKKTQILNYTISENNLYIKLTEIIKNNFESKIPKYYKFLSHKWTKKIEYNQLYLILANRIIKCCIRSNILIIKKKYLNKKKKKNNVILNKSIFESIVQSYELEKIQLPTLKPLIYNNSTNILTNKNSSYDFTYNNKYLDVLNYLNSQKMIINKDYLNYLLKLDDNKIYKLTNKQIELKSLKYLKHKKITKKKLNKLIQSLIFISNLFIIIKYSNYTFYFKYKSDSRGRIYQDNWPVNSLYTKIFSPLFIFEDLNKQYSPVKFNNIYWYISYKINKLNILSLRDATNSLFQITGCITLNKKLLKYTNIHNENERYNLNEFILSKYKDNINLLIHDIYDIKCDQKLLWDIENIQNLDKIDICIKNLILIDLAFLKSIIMTWCYNEQRKSTIKKIYFYIFNENKKYISLYWSISSKIYQYIFNIFKKEFPIYMLLKKFFGLIAKNASNENINIIIKHELAQTHSFEQHCYATNIKKVYVETIAKKKKYIYIKEILNNMSFKDNKRSITANTIQYLDSIIATQVVLECKKQGIPIIINHDCFYTNLINDKTILIIYNNILYKYLIEYDFLKSIIIYNKIINPSILKTYNTIFKMRDNTIHTIFKNDIKYSISLKDKNWEEELKKLDE